MPLQKQLISVPFAAGLDLKTDQIQLAPPKLLIAENCDFSSPGKIQKRAGYKSLPAAIPVGNALMSYQDELVACDADRLYSYESSIPSFIDKGPLVSTYVTKRQVVRNTYEQRAQDGVTDSTGLTCYAWEQYANGGLAGVFYCVIDGATGNTVKAPTLIAANGIKPKTVTTGVTFAIYYYDTSAMRLKRLVIPGATASGTHTPITITGSSGDVAISTTTPIYDVTISGGTPTIFLTFYTASGNIALWQFTSPASPILGFAKAAVITATPVCLTVFWDRFVTGPVICYASASAVKYNRFGPTTGATIPPVSTAGSGTVETIAGIVSVSGISQSSTGLSLTFRYTQYAISASNFLSHTRSLAGVFLRPVIESRSLGLASKPFAYNSVAYSTFAFQSPLQSTYFVVDQGNNAVAKLLYANGGGQRMRTDGLSTLTLVNVPASATVTINGIQFVATAGSNDIPNRLFKVGVSDNADATALSTVIAGNNMAGILSSFTNGTNGVVIIGFVASVVVAASGTINVATSTSGTDCLSEASPIPTLAPATTTTQWRVALLEKDSLIFQSNLPSLTQPDAGLTLIPYSQTGVSALTLDFFNPANSYLRAELGRNLHIGGGFLWMYDGLKPVEHGFHLYPELSVPAVVTDSGGSTTAGARQFCATYEWVDNEGQTHRSAPSIPINVTTDDSGTVTVTVPTLRVTAKQGSRTPVMIVPYATIAAPGTIFYQATLTPSPVASGGANAPIINDPTVDFVTFVFTMSDAQLQLQAQCYVTGGVLENISPNSTSALAVNHNRVFALDSTNPLSVWYSKQVQPGQPAEFSDFLTLNIDPRGGPVTAIAGLDSNLICFKKGSIFAIQGQGPDSTGAQNDFQDAALVTTTCGCINPRSVTLVPDGLIFQSVKGIYLLTRGLVAQYIGADVEAFNSATVTSAQLIPQKNEFRLTLQNNPQGAPIALSFDHFVGSWNVHTAINANDSAVFGGLFCYLRSDGKVFVETPNEFSDDGSFIQLKVQTASINMGALQGFGRCWRALLIGSYLSQHTLQVALTFDNDQAPTQFVTIAPPDPGTWGTTPPVWGGISTNQGPWGGPISVYQWDLRLAAGRRISAVSVTLSDSQVGNTVGASLSLSALLFEVGLLPGGRRLAAARTVG